jgi:hypothetical protein
MRSPKNEALRLLSLTAVLAGSASLAACGGSGNGWLDPLSTVVVEGPVLVPPPPVTPDPIPFPPDDAPGVLPPEEPPVEPAPDPVVPPVAPLAPNLAEVHGMAVVGAEIYVGDQDGSVWQLAPDGVQWALWATTPYGPIEAMTHVFPRNALYLVQGGRLTRIALDTRLVEVLATSDPFDFDLIPDFFDVTGLAFHPGSGIVYGLDRAQRAIFEFPDLDLADTAWGTFLGFAHDELTDLAYDGTEPPGVLIAIDAETQNLIEVDPVAHTWVVNGQVSYAAIQALALELPGMLVAVDNEWAALVRFQLDGTSIP